MLPNFVPCDLFVQGCLVHHINNLGGHRKEDRQLIFTTETASFPSNPEMKAHCEAVYNKFNTLTKNNSQIWPCLQLYAACALVVPLQQKFQTGSLLWSGLS